MLFRSLESVAFCCISTGEFHFPNDRAAQIATGTVKEFMQKETSVKKVVFNVFRDLDREIYGRLLCRPSERSGEGTEYKEGWCR